MCFARKKIVSLKTKKEKQVMEEPPSETVLGLETPTVKGKIGKFFCCHDPRVLRIHFPRPFFYPGWPTPCAVILVTKCFLCGKVSREEYRTYSKFIPPKEEGPSQ